MGAGYRCERRYRRGFGERTGCGWHASGFHGAASRQARRACANFGAAYGIRTAVFDADLADPDAPEKIYDFTKQQGLDIDLLINNAGFGQYGELTQVPVQRLLDMVQVNCAAVVHLSRLYLADMVARRCGDVLILASTAAFRPCLSFPLTPQRKLSTFCLRKGLPKR